MHNLSAKELQAKINKITEGKSIKKIEQDFDDTVKKLAQATHEWALALDCYRDDDSEILGFFVISESKGKESKPVWADYFNENPTSWAAVKSEMRKMGIPIVSSPRNGHYIGHPGEYGAEIASNLNGLTTRMDSIIRDVLILIDGGIFELGKEWASTRLKSELQGKLVEMLSAIRTFKYNMGLPEQLTFTDLMLMRGDDNSHDEDAA